MSKNLMKTVFASVLMVAAAASADTIDLTTAGAQGTLNGAVFQQIDPLATGTGNVDSFVQVFGVNAVIQAYNTTANNVLDNGAADPFNRAILLPDVPLVDLNGELFRRFQLDVNGNVNTPFLSLDEIQIFLSAVPNQSVTSFTNGILDLAVANLVYRLDTPGLDNRILLDVSLNSGHGSGDMFAYIPDSLFLGGAGSYVYLYSRFGETLPNSGGFQEWSLPAADEPGGDDQSGVVPEPATAVLLAGGLTAMAFRRFRTR